MATTRAAGITAAAGTRLTQLLFPDLFRIKKSHHQKWQWHSSSPRRACAHCEGFAPAAPRRAWVRVSEPISGLHLSVPVPVIGYVGLYPTYNLIGRRLVLRRRDFQTRNIPVFGIYGELISVSQGYAPPKVGLSACY